MYPICFLPQNQTGYAFARLEDHIAKRTTTFSYSQALAHCLKHIHVIKTKSIRAPSLKAMIAKVFRVFLQICNFKDNGKRKYKNVWPLRCVTNGPGMRDTLLIEQKYRIRTVNESAKGKGTFQMKSM